MTGPTNVPIVVLAAVTAVAIAVNLAVVSMDRSSTYRWWLVYVLAAMDLLIVGAFVALIGPGGAVVGFLVAILPYTFSEGRWVSHALALATSRVKR